MSDRRDLRKSLRVAMARRKTYTTPPKTPMNQWFRDALNHLFDTTGKDPSYDEIAAEMNRAKIGATYGKSTVQKMTTIRQINILEASVIARLTGYPMPDQSEDDADQIEHRILAELRRVPQERRSEAALAALATIRLAQSSEPEGSSGGEPSARTARREPQP